MFANLESCQQLQASAADSARQEAVMFLKLSMVERQAITWGKSFSDMGTGEASLRLRKRKEKRKREKREKK